MSKKKRKEKPASQLDAWEAQWNREEPVEMRQIREHEERKFGKRPSDPAARAQYDALLSSFHFWKMLAVVLILGLLFTLLIVGAVLGLDGSSDPCQVDANGYLDCYFSEPAERY